jgi:hypothetical protein
VRNNQALLRLLVQDLSIDIYAWADSGRHRIGDFHLNYAAGLEDSIIRTVAPPWNGARSAMQAEKGLSHLPPAARGRETIEPTPPASTSHDIPEDESASVSEVRALENAGVIQASPKFDVTLGKTYYHRGFFNVPVKFSELFPDHGTEISIYCGESRTLIRATVDRKANQASHTPRVYGKGSLTNWFSLYKRVDDIALIRVVSSNELELM